MNDQDKHFLQEMYSNGLAEVEGGHMAEQRSRDEIIHAFGRRMIHDGMQANQDLQALAHKLGVQLQSNIEGEAQQEIDRIQGLTGSAFDREYMMAQLHVLEKDLQIAKQHARQAQDNAVKECAGKLVSMLAAQLELARQTLETLQQQQPQRAY